MACMVISWYSDVDDPYWMEGALLWRMILVSWLLLSSPGVERGTARGDGVSRYPVTHAHAVLHQLKPPRRQSPQRLEPPSGLVTTFPSPPP